MIGININPSSVLFTGWNYIDPWTMNRNTQ